MITKAIEISFIITAIYVIFQQGMLLGCFRINTANLFDWLFGRKVSTYIQKPLWDCLPCMAGFLTIIITFSFNLLLILLVCGINVLIEKCFLDEELPGK